MAVYVPEVLHLNVYYYYAGNLYSHFWWIISQWYSTVSTTYLFSLWILYLLCLSRMEETVCGILVHGSNHIKWKNKFRFSSLLLVILSPASGFLGSYSAVMQVTKHQRSQPLILFPSIFSLCPQMLPQGHQQYQRQQPWKSGRAVLWQQRSPLKWRKSPQQPLAARHALPLRLRKKKQKDCCTVHYAKSLSTLPRNWRRTTVVRWSNACFLLFFFPFCLKSSAIIFPWIV